MCVFLIFYFILYFNNKIKKLLLDNNSIHTVLHTTDSKSCHKFDTYMVKFY